MPRRRIPQNRTSGRIMPNVEPALPTGGGLSDLSIDPPLLVDPRADAGGGGELPASDTGSSFRSGGEGNYDAPNQGVFRGGTPDDNAAFSHPDDALFFSPSGDLSSHFTPSVSTQFPWWRNPSNLSPFFSQLNNRSFFQGNRPDYAGPISNDQGRVLVGDETTQPFDVPSLSTQGAIQGTNDAPAGPVTNPGLLASATTTGVANRTQPSSPRIGIGSLTSMNARLGTAHNPLFGVGAVSGQHYFNDGTGWKPIGLASGDVRFAQNSGTGNFTAGQYTDSYVAGGGDPGSPNNMGNTGDAGHTEFGLGGQVLGQIMQGDEDAITHVPNPFSGNNNYRRFNIIPTSNSRTDRSGLT